MARFDAAPRGAGPDRRIHINERMMNVPAQIDAYIAAQPELERRDMLALDSINRGLMPGYRLWFRNGKDEKGKTVSSPNIGYGAQMLTYADGSTREFYETGISASTTGISIDIKASTTKRLWPIRTGLYSVKRQ